MDDSSAKDGSSAKDDSSVKDGPSTKDGSSAKEIAPKISKLLSLPQEIILLIVQAVREAPAPITERLSPGEEQATYNQELQDIRHLRLQCKQLARIGAEFLIPFLGVDISEDSLARFSEILREPAIRRGVRHVRIRLQAYDWVLSTSIEKYSEEMIKRFRLYGPLIVNKEARRLARDYVEAWREPERWPKEAQQLRKAFALSHEQYRKRYYEQESVSTGRFVTEISKGLQNCKKKLRVDFTDFGDFWRRKRQTMISATKDNLLDAITEPQACRWDEILENDSNKSGSFLWLIFPLLAAFGDVGLHIKELRLKLSRVRSQEVEVFGRKKMIQEAIQNLQSFWDLGLFDPELKVLGPDFKKQLYSCLPPATLQKISLAAVGLEPQPQILWPNLTSISLFYVQFDCRRLSTLLDPMEPHAANMCLHYCRVTDGSWADVLDLLRSRQQLTTLHQPKGGEFDGMSPANEKFLLVRLPN
ncbi:hypothetical protein Daus18300_005034 [Diaporthe australafricana]|uniref:F-box domain-containing protein n=1 Tax=Diaporthe australafricana TaxID=127596 RepID=A0ABR3X437_9PEZI